MATLAPTRTLPEPLPGDERAVRLWRGLALGSAGVAAGFALAALAADGNGHPVMAGGHWLWPPAVTAISLLLASGTLVLLALHPQSAAGGVRPAPRAQWWGARWVAAATFAWSLGVMLERLALTPGGLAIRLSPTMMLMMLLAVAFGLRPALRWLAAVLALMIGVAGLIGVFDQALQSSWSPLGPHTRAINPAVAICLLMLSLGWMAAEPHLRPLSVLWEPGSTGWLMRRLIPVALGFPLLLAWLRGEQSQARALGIWGGSLAFVLVSFIVFLTLVWRAATALDRLDTSRADLQAYAHEISDLYHHAPCGYHSLDETGRIVKINDTELAWLGYRREELVGRMGFADLLTPASRAVFERHFPALRDAGVEQEMELELRRSDGSLLAAVVTATAIRDRRGRFLRTRSTVFDATQRKRAEAALRISEARNRAILASAADAIVTLGEQGSIVDFNPAAELMFDMRRGVAVELFGGDLVAPGHPLRHIPLAVLAGEEGRTAEAAFRRRREFVARRADGTEFPAELTVTRVAGETPGLFTAFIRDLTERKHAEAELRASEERLRLLLDSTGEGIYALDLEGQCILCNRAAVRLLGYQRAEELLGRSLHSLIHHTRADGNPYPAQACKSMLAARGGVGIEVDDELFWRADGNSIPVEYRSYPVEREGQPVGLVVTFTDITTRRGLESQIRQSQKMEAVGRLAAGIAHDFNNLLTVINGYSDMLLEDGQREEARLPAGALEKLESVRKAGDRAAVLTHQLLAFSRQQVLQPQVLDLNHMVRELEPLLRRTVGEDVEFAVELASGLRAVKADPSQIDQILMNLVVNARDAIPSDWHGERERRIRIETRNATLDEAFVRPHAGLAPGNYVLLSVRDTGTGMRTETQAHIFEPFFTTKPQGQGTGLGLPTVFGIARQSGGTVVMESAWGRGTTMHVYLPAHTAGVTAAPSLYVPPATERAAGGGETILVVEDEAGLRQLVLEVLRGRGYTAIEASDPDHALRLSCDYAGAIQLLITDIVMPGMNGRALAEKLTLQRPGLRVLFISGYPKQANADLPFLKKPFSPETLAHLVRTLLDEERPVFSPPNGVPAAARLN